MRRKLFTIAAGALAGLCAGVCVLWARAPRVGRPDYLSVRTPFGRGIARCDAGVVTLIGPPRAGPPANEATVRMLAGLMRNGDLDFYCVSRPHDPHTLVSVWFGV